MKSKAIIISAGVVAVAVAVVTAAVTGYAFNSDLNVESHEPRTINGTRVIMLIDPSSALTYLSVDKSTVLLPPLNGKESRTGEVQVTITAMDSPAKEATFVVKGVLYVEGHQRDVKEFDLKVRQR